MAAEKVKELTQKRVEVIPTAEVAQGIRAAFAFDINQSVDVNVEEMKNAYADLKCGEVTNAVRNTNLDGFEISEGDIIGLDGKTIIADSKSVEETTLAVIDKLVDELERSDYSVLRRGCEQRGRREAHVQAQREV